MKKENLKKEIDEIAIRIVEDYHIKVDSGISPKDYFVQESFCILRNELIEKMMRYDGIKKDDSDSWELMLKYVIRSIPSYKINKTESQKNSFVHYLNSFFVEKHKKMIQARKEGKDITPFLDEKREIDQLVRIISFCEAEGVDLEKPTDAGLDKVVSKFYTGKEDRPQSEKRKKMAARMRIALNFRRIDGTLPIIQEASRLKSPNPEDLFVSKNVEKNITLIHNILYLVKKTIKDNARTSPERTHSRVRCLYTNEIAKYVREYTEKKHGEEYEKDTPEKQQKVLRAQYMSDCFRPISDELFEKLLIIDYLEFVLRDPKPDRIYRICMNKYKTDDEGTIKFEQKSVAKYYGVSEETVSKSYKPLFNEVNSELMRLYDIREC